MNIVDEFRRLYYVNEKKINFHKIHLVETYFLVLGAVSQHVYFECEYDILRIVQDAQLESTCDLLFSSLNRIYFERKRMYLYNVSLDINAVRLENYGFYGMSSISCNI